MNFDKIYHQIVGEEKLSPASSLRAEGDRASAQANELYERIVTLTRSARHFEAKASLAWAKAEVIEAIEAKLKQEEGQ